MRTRFGIFKLNCIWDSLYSLGFFHWSKYILRYTVQIPVEHTSQPFLRLKTEISEPPLHLLYLSLRVHSPPRSSSSWPKPTSRFLDRDELRGEWDDRNSDYALPRLVNYPPTLIWRSCGVLCTICSAGMKTQIFTMIHATWDEPFSRALAMSIH